MISTKMNYKRKRDDKQHTYFEQNAKGHEDSFPPRYLLNIPITWRRNHWEKIASYQGSSQLCYGVVDYEDESEDVTESKASPLLLHNVGCVHQPCDESQGILRRAAIVQIAIVPGSFLSKVESRFFRVS
jgi:hypothetical protein